MNLTARGSLFLLATAALAAPSFAQSGTPQAPAAQASPSPQGLEKMPSRWHLYGGLGYGSAGGDYGEFLETPVQLDLRIAKASVSGKWRFGAGLHFGSMAMKAPYQDEDEWGHLETSLTAVSEAFSSR